LCDSSTGLIDLPSCNGSAAIVHHGGLGRAAHRTGHTAAPALNADVLIFEIGEQGTNDAVAGRRRLPGGYLKIPVVFEEESAQMNARTNVGMTPLHVATASDHKDIAELLRAHGGKE
jgi:ankyrin repeat protein